MIRLFSTILLGWLLSAHGYAGVTKCTDPEGKVYFTDGACPENSTEEYQPIKQSSSGFEAPRSSISQQGSTKGGEGLIRNSRNREKPESSNCLRAKQNLASVNKKIRKGYTTAYGNKLKAQRQGYELAIKKNCK